MNVAADYREKWNWIKFPVTPNDIRDSAESSHTTVHAGRDNDADQGRLIGQLSPSINVNWI